MRQRMVEKDAVDCMVALPGQLFYSTQIPACLWFLAKDKSANGHRDRRGEVLFIDARKLGYMADRTRREFKDEDMAKIADTYHAWRAKQEDLDSLGLEPYEDVPGFCKTATKKLVKKHGYILTPGRFVGAKEIDDDGIPFEERFSELRKNLAKQFQKGRELEAQICSMLDGVSAK